MSDEAGRGLASRSPRPQPAFDPRLRRGSLSRYAGEGSWAWQDSNLQPDRYEREELDRLR
jgi:hypothetical protein